MEMWVILVQGAITLIGIGITGYFGTRQSKIANDARQAKTEQFVADKLESLQKDQSEMRKRLDELSETDSCCATLQKDVVNIKKEQRLTITALKACLDGLTQLGCNHTVPSARAELDGWLNEQAHE